MKTYDSGIPNYSKLYGHIVEFKGFKNIEENKLYEIEEMVNRFKKYEKSRGIEGYNIAITHITSSQMCRRFSFDEKMVYLILCCDPYLVHFYNFISTSIISNSDINELECIDEINMANEARQQQLYQLKNNIIQQIGFYDSNLINIEFSFFKRFYSDKVLIDNVKKDMIDILRKTFTNYYLISKLSEQEILDVMRKSDFYINYMLENNIRLSINTLAFNTFCQGEILDLKNCNQKILFIILTMDRKFKACDYYDELELIDRQQEIENLIGFYDENFIKAEKRLKKIYK